ncbi:hypothetical protein B7494_g6764 [Chlorociboria aeruginascens]|nr:hypothetical protein B7494_g6764 [Chlorociboria aeruginascens]
MHIFTPLSFVLASLGLATYIQVTIPASAALPNPNGLPPSTSASLTTLSNIVRAPLRADNTFEFRNVSSGSYLFDIHCPTHAFAPLRVDIHEDMQLGGGEPKHITEVEAWGTFRGNEWRNKGEAAFVKEVGDAGGSRIWGLEAKALGEKSYLVERAGFSPLSLLKNPMILIAGVSMLVVFGMPYLMDNMDPEMRAEFEERQKASPLSGGQAAANPLQNFDAAAWLAGSSTKKGDPPVERGITR